MATELFDSVVLRTIRYGESDLIAHLFTLEAGRCSVIVKGGRKTKTRMDGRLEPLAHAKVEVYAGKGDLSIVKNVTLVDTNFPLRESYTLQEFAARGMSMLGRLTVEHEVNESAFHLTCSFLRVLATIDTGEKQRPIAGAMLCAYRLKMLHTLGIAPQLSVCVRCGTELLHPRSWSARDGGTVCEDCAIVVDGDITQPIVDAASWLLSTSLSAITASEDIPGPALTSDVEQQVVAAICREHAGVAIKL